MVACQAERSQHKNRSTAMKMLRGRLYEKQRQEREAEFAKNYTSQQMAISFGSQVRTYTLQPYTMVKDERTDHKSTDAQGVLDGELDEFIEAYLLKAAGERTDRRTEHHGRKRVASEEELIARAQAARREAAGSRRSTPYPSGILARDEAKRREVRRDRQRRGAARALPGEGEPAAAASTIRCMAACIAKRGPFLVMQTPYGSAQALVRPENLPPEQAAQAKVVDLADHVAVSGAAAQDADRRARREGDALRARGQGAAAAARQVARPDRRREALPRALRRHVRRTPRSRRCSARARDRVGDAQRSSMRAASSRSRRRCCIRCSAARPRGRSTRITTRSTSRSTCASRPSCT